MVEVGNWDGEGIDWLEIGEGGSIPLENELIIMEIITVIKY